MSERLTRFTPEKPEDEVQVRDSEESASEPDAPLKIVKERKHSKKDSLSSQEIPKIAWITKKELRKFPLVEKGKKRMSTLCKFRGPITSLKIRVRLLEFPKEGGNGDFGVVEDRVFSWQEKVFSEKEAEKLRKKDPSTRSTNEIEYLKRIEESPGSIGRYLHSFIEGDPFTFNYSKKSPISSKCGANHAAATNSDQEWEDVDENAPPTATPTAPSATSSKQLGPQEKSARQLKREEREAQRLLQDREQAGAKQRKIEDLMKEEAQRLDSLLQSHSRAKRPNKPISSFLLPATLENLSPSPSRGSKDHHHEEEEERSLKKQQQQQQQHSIGLIRRPSPPTRRLPRLMEHLPSSTMLIMSTLPELSKSLVVCRVKAYRTAGVVALHCTPTGFRPIADPTKKHAFALLWEVLGRDEKVNGAAGDKATVTVRATTGYGGMSFEGLSGNELRVSLLGEIVSAKGFEGGSEPLCVHYMLELGPGWVGEPPLLGNTQSSYTTDCGAAFFSSPFSTQLSFSMDKSLRADGLGRPVLLFMVASLREGSGRVRSEGYGYCPIPSSPGSYTFTLPLWKVKARCILDRMRDVFLDANPSLSELQAVHLAKSPEGRPLLYQNRLGLETEGSGEITLRLHVLHQTPSSLRDQGSKLELLQKMSSASILKSVEAVLEAFHRAREKAAMLKE